MLFLATLIISPIFWAFATASPTLSARLGKKYPYAIANVMILLVAMLAAVAGL